MFTTRSQHESMGILRTASYDEMASENYRRFDNEDKGPLYVDGATRKTSSSSGGSSSAARNQQHWGLRRAAGGAQRLWWR